MWKTILASTVISTLISSIVAYINFKKESQLKYITQERKEWRDTLRNIAYELYGADIHDTYKLITSLKVRINAYGYGIKDNKDVSQDSHIWNLIANMEDLQKNKCADISFKLKQYQNQMIDYISLLLKDDWERSKSEVIGIRRHEFFSLIFAVFEILVIGTLVSCYIEVIGKYTELNILTTIVAIFTSLMLLLISILLIRHMRCMKKWLKSEKQKATEAVKKYEKKAEIYANAIDNISKRY